MMKNFAVAMYCAKYAKRLGVEQYLIGYYYNSKKDVAAVLIPKADLLKVCNVQFEELSPANKEFAGKRDTKKHCRLNASAKLLKNYHIQQLGGREPELIPSAEFERCREIIGDMKNQKNRGYALELAILGDNWNSKKRGIDIDGENIEIKFSNGQIEIYG